MTPRPSIARALLRWYDDGRRGLPWRRRPSAYGTLVSELMLQQTVVATVVPYFERFMSRFPDVRALADATEDEVLAMWSGLGYYSRARNLHRAARVVVDEHGGQLPADEAALRRLPGVGEYTAAAIAAIAFGARTFALDGNAARVVARLAAVEESIDRPDVRARLRAVGQTLVPADRPGDFAQAVMELGALVCVAASARCEVCPLSRWCRAHAEGKAATIPARTPKRAKVAVRLSCVAAVRDGRVLLVRRPAGTLLGGTWALPAAEVGDDARGAAERALVEVGLSAAGPLRRAGEIRHVFTHRDVTADVYVGCADGEGNAATPTRWFALDRPEHVALSSFARKTLSVLDNSLRGAGAPRRSRRAGGDPP